LDIDAQSQDLPSLRLRFCLATQSAARVHVRLAERVILSAVIFSDLL
jgi:hypothetical protein